MERGSARFDRPSRRDTAISPVPCVPLRLSIGRLEGFGQRAEGVAGQSFGGIRVVALKVSQLFRLRRDDVARRAPRMSGAIMSLVAEMITAINVTARAKPGRRRDPVGLGAVSLRGGACRFDRLARVSVRVVGIVEGGLEQVEGLEALSS